MPSAGRLRYLERAADPSVRPRGTLLLIHAFPLNARMFEAQLTLAGSGWRVVAPHLRRFDGADGDPPASRGAFRSSETSSPPSAPANAPRAARDSARAKAAASSRSR